MRTPDIPRPIAETHRPRAAFPPNATDCHAHIFGPQNRYPLLPQTHFVPHECPLSEYVRMLRILGCERGVLVQPSVYGTNNSAIEEALQSGAFNLRGVAVVTEDVTDKELERLHGLGFRGIRINTASATPGLKLEHAPRIAERIKHLGWHLQFFVNFRDSPWMEAELAKLPVNIVIDHFGRIAVSDGLNAPPFTALLRLLKREHYGTSEQVPRGARYDPNAMDARSAVQPIAILWASRATQQTRVWVVTRRDGGAVGC